MGRSEDLYRLDYSVVGVILALFLARAADVVRFVDFTVYGVAFVFEATIYAVLATCILLFTRAPNRHLLVTFVSAILVLFSLLAAIRALEAPWAVLSLDFGNADLKGVPTKVAPALVTRMLAARVIISASVEAIFVAFFVKKLSVSIRRRREKS